MSGVLVMRSGEKFALKLVLQGGLRDIASDAN